MKWPDIVLYAVLFVAVLGLAKVAWATATLL
jgi:hypothetical protein